MPARPESSCPLCGHGSLTKFLTRDSVPVHQNLVCEVPDHARTLARGQLTMCVCDRCGFVHNQTFEPDLLRYGENYDNTQTYSPAFDRHVNERVEHLVQQKGLRDCCVVEVGCGKGHFLQKLTERRELNIRGHGFDPSYIGPESLQDGRLQFHRRFFGQQCDIRADVVICRHVIEHIPKPLDLLASVRAALAASPRAKVFFETPCVKWILDHQVIWDFFYEHCSLFTANSLASAFRQSGFDVKDVSNVFGDQYLWLEADVAAEPERSSMISSSYAIRELAVRYGQNERQRTAAWRLEIEKWSRSGGVAIWGAGAKGVTFANLVDSDRRWIRCLVDINPNKQGRYLPGTGHLIVPPTAIPSMHVSHAVLLNPVYRTEVSLLLEQLRLKIKLVDLMQDKAMAA